MGYDGERTPGEQQTTAVPVEIGGSQVNDIKQQKKRELAPKRKILQFPLACGGDVLCARNGPGG